MASLGRLVAGVAHEANTPISNIRLSASAAHLRLQRIEEEMESGSLRKSTLKDAVAFLRESMSAIESASRKAADVVANFKQIAVDPSGQLARDFSVAECLGVVVRSLAEQLAGSNIRIDSQIDPLARVHGDPGMFEQIIIHLVTNAAQHAFEGRSSGTISLVVECHDGQVQLRLSDDGAGIPPAIRDKIFSPYFTTKFGRGSSGLGLYIVQNIITGAFGGNIEFRSQTDSGTTFTITIPAATPNNPD
jgi:signal transduction histidine kinase